MKDRNLYLDINDYVFGVVAAEMPALFNDEALKSTGGCSKKLFVEF
ncbi:MAG: SpoIID/LytB domain-containing protein [Clostridium sp.]|nr:MAG: SpoIID/LytB domain-containing protein [Clostridium sp.]